MFDVRLEHDAKADEMVHQVTNALVLWKEETRAYLQTLLAPI